MTKSQALEVLKGALLFEMRGKAFYEHHARETRNPGLKKVFETMSIEEDGHVTLLARQMKSLASSGQFEPAGWKTAQNSISEQILTDGIKQQVAAAGYEAAAISAAMAMEEKAVRYYSEQATAAADPLAKDIYQWLADWEKTHLNLLAKLDRELLESVWHDNQFWPLG